MGSWWQRATPGRRLVFAGFAIALWIFVLIREARHPHGSAWFFFIAAPFYLGFFIVQIRRALADRRNR